MTEGLSELRRCGWLHEAHVIVSVLEAEGIEAFIPDEHMLGVRPELAAMMGGVRVLVPGRELDRANEVLAAMEAGADG